MYKTMTDALARLPISVRDKIRVVPDFFFE
jgi:hypothetical protein